MWNLRCFCCFYSDAKYFKLCFKQAASRLWYDAQLLRRALASNKMAAHTGEKRGLEHLDEYEPKTAKQPRNMHDKMIEARLVVVLEGATLETVKVSLKNTPQLYKRR